MINEDCCKAYSKILNDELREATGCTEPIAIALAAAKARQVLGVEPEKVVLNCSGNIIKNVKAVVIPNAGGQKGIPTAAILGIVAGDADKNLQVISFVADDAVEKLNEARNRIDVKVNLAQNVPTLYIEVIASKGDESAEVTLAVSHTNIAKIVKNGEVLVDNPYEVSGNEFSKEYELLNLDDIIEYATTADLSDVTEVLERQIVDNSAIGQEGLDNCYGEKVGRTLLECYDTNDISIRAIAKAAAGSDARMNGCPMGVVINSGSGNQGMTVSIPVIEYAKEYNVSHEKLLRALALANLVALHQKQFIGYLSAYCGVTSAAAGAASGICWLLGGDKDVIGNTVSNTVAIIGGMVCDGAKSSCAGKICMALQTALLSMRMAFKDRHFKYGEGMVKKTPNDTIKAYGRMGKVGMKETDVEILNIMLED